MKISRGIVLLGLACASAGVFAQRPGEAELVQCLSNTLGMQQMNSLLPRTVQISGGTADTTYAVSVHKGTLRELACGAFRVYADSTTKAMKYAVRSGGADGYVRPALKAELDRMRSFVAADPGWVLYHVLGNLDRYTVVLESNGEMSYTWSERYLLSDPEEKLYGVYGEKLVIDPAKGLIREFGILSKDGAGHSVTDVVHQYTQENTNSWQVVRTSYEGSNRSVTLMVTF